ncbi:ISL3 family transposase [Kitasatospora sp. NPDC017646]|uniref:ISL3 family transposase n=1 Tax=Kitasatospora sp. NPDC017646 TaxID=3364024 RepID=UPI0037AA317D
MRRKSRLARPNPCLLSNFVRRFRCREPSCPRATFVEQAAGLTFRHGRRTQGLHAALQRLALMLAGRAGSRLADTLAVPVSRSTLLRLIRALPERAAATPRVLGIDEFALRKGPDYGTILIDIETPKPVDLLPDRTTSTVARWLAEHPGVKVICRDRSPAFAEAGRLGAPEAVHVADRWHIWSNLAEAVEKTVVQHRALLREPSDNTTATAAAVMENLDLEAASPMEPRTTGRLSDRVREQHAAVHALLDQGIALRVITRQLGLARNTVRRYRMRRARTSSWSGGGPAAPASSIPTSHTCTSDGPKAAPSPTGCSRKYASADTPAARTS